MYYYIKYIYIIWYNKACTKLINPAIGDALSDMLLSIAILEVIYIYIILLIQYINRIINFLFKYINYIL